jgi:dinuclear metal center YbgI/SA1388 family protein
MKIFSIISFLEQVAPPSLQESYDNCGLLTGNPEWDCTGVLCALDVTEEVVQEAKQKKCNLIIAHHPVIFKGLKKINGRNLVERVVIRSIKDDIALYALHTSLDNVAHGVNGKIADLLGLAGRSLLLPKANTLCKLATYVPSTHLDVVREALFTSGAGQVGNYTECSFSVQGEGTFTGGAGTNPFLGTPGIRHRENEFKVEVILPVERTSTIIRALREAHPYEEVAYDLIPLANEHQGIGSGLTGSLPQPLVERDFLQLVQQLFGCGVIRHSRFTGKKISKVALCGGAGSFLITSALSAGADAFITADLKYHEFFEPDGKLLLCDIGHYESEQFTISLLDELLRQKFPTFAILKTEFNTNPIHYYS